MCRNDKKLLKYDLQIELFDDVSPFKLTKKLLEENIQSLNDYKKAYEQYKGEDSIYEEALKDAFHTIDNKISKEDYAMDTGTTACVVLVTPTVIICCNAGDSRGVLMQNNKAVELSFDHKP